MNNENDKLRDVHLGIIKKISIYNGKWDGRNVVKGLELFFQDRLTLTSSGKDSFDFRKSVKIGLSDLDHDNHKSSIAKTFELGENEYISYVKGRKGWMLDQITCVLSVIGLDYCLYIGVVESVAFVIYFFTLLYRS